MHRDPAYWGPTGMSLLFMTECLGVHLTRCSFPAQEFDPDRFLDDRVGKYLVPNPFIFLPFNAGPRICLGQQVKHLRPTRPFMKQGPLTLFSM